MADRFLSRAAVCQRVGLSHSTIWRLQKLGQFPAFERLSPGRVGVLESNVDRWLEGERSGWPTGAGGAWRGGPGTQGKRKGTTR